MYGAVINLNATRMFSGMADALCNSELATLASGLSELRLTIPPFAEMRQHEQASFQITFNRLFGGTNDVHIQHVFNRLHSMSRASYEERFLSYARCCVRLALRRSGLNQAVIKLCAGEAVKCEADVSSEESSITLSSTQVLAYRLFPDLVPETFASGSISSRGVWESVTLPRGFGHLCHNATLHSW